MKLREVIGEALGLHIAEGQWRESFKRFDIEGKVTQKTLLTLVLLLAQRVEELENELRQPQQTKTDSHL